MGTVRHGPRLNILRWKARPAWPRGRRPAYRAAQTPFAAAAVTLALTAHARSSPNASHRRSCSAVTSVSARLRVVRLSCATAAARTLDAAVFKHQRAESSTRRRRVFACAPFLTRFRNPPTRLSSKRSSARVVLLYVAVADESASAPASVAALTSTFEARVSSAPPAVAAGAGLAQLRREPPPRPARRWPSRWPALAASASSSSAAHCGVGRAWPRPRPRPRRPRAASSRGRGRTRTPRRGRSRRRSRATDTAPPKRPRRRRLWQPCPAPRAGPPRPR